MADLVAGLAPWPLLIHGPPGRGKTCAALALCDHVRKSEYLTAADLTAKVMASFGGKEPFNWSPYSPLPTDADACRDGCHLLVIDEVGVRANVTDTHYDAVQRVLDMWETYPLIVVSNLNAAGIARVYDDRIASRCEAGTVVELADRDRRTA